MSDAAHDATEGASSDPQRQAQRRREIKERLAELSRIIDGNQCPLILWPRDQCYDCQKEGSTHQHRLALLVAERKKLKAELAQL